MEETWKCSLIPVATVPSSNFLFHLKLGLACMRLCHSEADFPCSSRYYAKTAGCPLFDSIPIWEMTSLAPRTICTGVLTPELAFVLVRGFSWESVVGIQNFPGNMQHCIRSLWKATTMESA